MLNRGEWGQASTGTLESVVGAWIWTVLCRVPGNDLYCAVEWTALKHARCTMARRRAGRIRATAEVLRLLARVGERRWSVGVTTHAPGLGSLPRYLLGMYTVVYIGVTVPQPWRCLTAPAHQRTSAPPGQTKMHLGKCTCTWAETHLGIWPWGCYEWCIDLAGLVCSVSCIYLASHRPALSPHRIHHLGQLQLQLRPDHTSTRLSTACTSTVQCVHIVSIDYTLLEIDTLHYTLTRVSRPNPPGHYPSPSSRARATSMPYPRLHPARARSLHDPTPGAFTHHRK